MQFIKHGFFRDILISLLIIPFFSILNAKAQSTHNSRVNIGFAYPFSSNGTHAPADTNLFSFNLIAGVSAAEEGFSFAGISSVIKKDARGMQFAGFSNHTRGLQIAGIGNITRKEMRGIQIGGVFNYSKNLQFRLIKGLSLFAGPSYSLYRTDPLSQTAIGYKKDIAPASAKAIANGKAINWTGWTAGINLF